MSAHYAVIGHPVKHSRSPDIHAAFAQQTGADIVYARLPAPANGFTEVATAFFNDGGRGLNVTLPFKGQACALVDTLTNRARVAQAVNTIAVQADGRWLGDTTDGIGLVRDLRDNLGLELERMRVLILGAGGAVQGVLGPLLALAPKEVVVANRTAGKAEQLALHFAGAATLHGIGLGGIHAFSSFDLIINGTAASLAGEVPPLPDNVLAHGGAAYDMLYATQPTAFMTWAANHGAEQIWDGFGMLVEQAAESFSIWRGVHPETGPIIADFHPRARAKA